VLFRYSPDRKGERPRAHLQHFRGILQADAYGGFNGLYDREHEPLIEAACWAHARRKYFEIYDSTASPIALEALERIGELYKIEDEIRGKLPDERKAVRQARATPLLKGLYDWLRATVRKVSKKSASPAPSVIRSRCGAHSRAMQRMDPSRSTTIPWNESCARWLSEEKTIYSLDPMPVASALPPSTA
jgi:hypothetical protein